jgi:serine/threonine protein kinase
MGLAKGEIVLDRYVIEAMIGQGGMGEVYRARHHKLGMPVAIKTITGDASPELVARFAREAMLLARVRHPNVVSILDVGATASGTECMVMEFLEGEGLDARLERRGALPWNEVRAIGLSILKGLDAIHGAGIVHRDLKPSNVLIVRGTPEVVKLVDFGIAHSSHAAKYTRTGAVIGTPAYMSPEQLVGAELDARSDLYSLALMLYELVSGRLPFGDEPTAALRRLRDAVPPPAVTPPLPTPPAAFVAALMSALELEAAARPGSARAYYAMLHASKSASTASLEQVQPVHPNARTQTVAAQRAAAPRAAAAGAPRARTAMPQARPGPARPPAPPVPQPHAEEPQHEELSAYAGAHEAHGMSMPMRQPTMQQGAGMRRAIVAARLPVSRMSREEQKALAQAAAPGRTYHLGGGVWFAVLAGGSDQEVTAAAGRVAGALQSRYGDTCKVVWAPASSSFALTPASLAGAAPLPPDISRLLEMLL